MKPTTKLRMCWPLLAALLGGCAHMLAHVPGPEAPELLALSRGTIVLSEANASGSNDGVLVDLPTLRRREFDLEHDPQLLSGPNDRGELVYTYELREGFVASLTQAALLPVYGEFFDSPPIVVGLRVHDVATGAEREVLANVGVDVLATAPVGPCAVLVLSRVVTPPPDPVTKVAPTPQDHVLLYDLATGAEREVVHGLGDVRRCDWLQDGSAFALSGPAGGVRFDFATLARTAHSAASYGPFTPDGQAWFVAQEDRWRMMRLEAGREVGLDARFPARLHARYPWRNPEPAGLCGPGIGVYLAHPTEGRGRVMTGREGGFLIAEACSVKIAHVDGGAFFTVAAVDEDNDPVRYSPRRLAEFER